MSDRWRWAITSTLPGAFIGFLDNLIAILTLGYVASPLHLNFCLWRMRREMRRNGKELRRRKG